MSWIIYTYTVKDTLSHITYPRTVPLKPFHSFVFDFFSFKLALEWCDRARLLRPLNAQGGAARGRLRIQLPRVDRDGGQRV